MNDRAAVGERVVNRELGAVGRLELLGVERARSGLRGGTAALRAAKRRPAVAVAEQEQLDAPVGGGLECLLPSSACTPVTPALLAPAVERLLHAHGLGMIKVRARDFEQVVGRGAR